VAERLQEYDLSQLGSGPLKRSDIHEFLHVVSIRRLQHATYPDTNRILARVVRALPDRDGAPVRVLVDQTGGGDAARDYLITHERIRPIGISITGGDNSNSRSFDDHTVPKRHLVESLAFAAEIGKIRIAAGIEHGILLAEELRAFSLKVRESGHEAFEGDRQNDDLVCSVMYITWYCEKSRWHPDPNFKFNRPEHGILGLMNR
jgi:hypothetical protein